MYFYGVESVKKYSIQTLIHPSRQIELISFLTPATNESVEEENESPLECETLPDFVFYEDSFFELADWFKAVMLVGNIVIMIFAVCGNIAAEFIIFRSKTTKMSTKMFLISLAFGDLMLTIFSCPVELGTIMSRYQSWIFGKFLCATIPFVQVWLVMSNSFVLLAIAFERYVTIVWSFKPVLHERSIWRLLSPYIGLIFIWIFPAGFAVPKIWYYDHASFWTAMKVNETYYIRPRNETCENYYLCFRSPFDVKNIAYYSGIGTIFFGLLFSFAFCYISIICFIKKHDHIRNPSSRGKNEVSGPTSITGETDNSRNAQGRTSKENDTAVCHRYRRTLNLIMGLIFLFLCCRTPIWILNIVDNAIEWGNSEIKSSVKHSLVLLSNLNCAVNPFMYTIWNDALRSQVNVGANRDNLSHKSSLCSCFNKMCTFGSGSSEHRGPRSIIGIFRRRKNDKYDVSRLTKAMVSSHSTQKFCVSEKIEWKPSSNGTVAR